MVSFAKNRGVGTDFDNCNKTTVNTIFYLCLNLAILGV